MDKKRCSNFIKDEIMMLVDLVEKYKNIVECKRTDCISNAAKERQWRKIEIEFNSICGTGRTAKMLRSKWDSMKKNIKKEYSEIRQNLYKTGGGPPDEKILSRLSNKILMIIGVAATGTESKFDSDFVKTPDCTTVASNNFSDDEEISTDVGEPSQESPHCSWKSWNPQQLRTPTSRPLLLSTQNSAILDITTEESEVLQSEIQKDIISEENLKKSNQTSVKRKICNKEPISSKIRKGNAAIYEELAKKKIEFIDFQIALLKEESENREKRLVEKHQLEIKILEAELKSKTNLS